MQNEDEFVRLDIWAAMAGRWQFAPGKVTYLGPHADRPTPPFGLVIAKPRMRSGKMLAKVRFGKNAQTSNGRIVIGYNAESRGYFSAGIGGYDFAYVLDEYIDTRGWRALAAAGNKDNIAPSSIRLNNFCPRTTGKFSDRKYPGHLTQSSQTIGR